MNLVVIWLVISVVSTIIVLMSIRSAPFIEDEPLDSDRESEIRFDSRHNQESDRPRPPAGEDRSEICGLKETQRTLGRSTLPALGNFPIVRSKQTPS